MKLIYRLFNYGVFDCFQVLWMDQRFRPQGDGEITQEYPTSTGIRLRWSVCPALDDSVLFLQGCNSEYDTAPVLNHTCDEYGIKDYHSALKEWAENMEPVRQDVDDLDLNCPLNPDLYMETPEAFSNGPLGITRQDIVFPGGIVEVNYIQHLAFTKVKEINPSAAGLLRSALQTRGINSLLTEPLMSERDVVESLLQAIRVHTIGFERLWRSSVEEKVEPEYSSRFDFDKLSRVYVV